MTSTPFSTTCGRLWHVFVIILQLPADRKSVLAEIFSRWRSMPVIEALAGVRLESNHIYYPTPHTLVSVVEGQLRRRNTAPAQRAYFSPHRSILRLPRDGSSAAALDTSAP